MSDETYEDVELEEINDDEPNADVDWQKEALKYKAIADRRKEKLEKLSSPKVEPKSEERQEVPKPSDILKADEFKLYRMGYDEQQIDLIMHNGGMKVLEDEKSPLALGLKIAREQRNAEEASSHVSDTQGQSEVERKYTPEQMRNMPKEELEKLIGFAE